jgi:predicted RecB family nuclease
MLKTPHGNLYSATDLVNFLDCPHCTALDLIDFIDPLPKSEDSDEAKLIQAKGFEHEKRYLEKLRARGEGIVDLSGTSLDLDGKVQATLSAMQSGAAVIYQAALRDGQFFGYADFLRKVPRASALGDFSYEVVDTKLARNAKASFVVQLAFYSGLLAKLQGVAPRMMHVMLGEQSEKSYACAQFSRYVNNISQRFLSHIQAMQPHIQPGMGMAGLGTYPDPCDRCSLCKWSGRCEQRRLDDDHLSQVAGITRIQIKKLHAAGITTLAQLGGCTPQQNVPKMADQTLEKLMRQAALQLQGRETGHPHHEILAPNQDGSPRGFARLPKPSPGDMFFDMEGDPLEEGGLEYLFGIYQFDEQGEPHFIPFWGHDRAAEKKAFEAFMDHVAKRLQAFPDAHIYHYAHYEQTALKKLMCLHGTRETEVDNLLRQGKLVDLYKVVREALRVSEPGYSIKNLERFYLEKRSGDVVNAGASIVFYERWKATGEPKLLQEIEDYNHEDVRSTYELRKWLLTLRPEDTPWLGASQVAAEAEQAAASGEPNPHEQRILEYRARLVDPLPEDRQEWDDQAHLRELIWQLLDFHRRAEKPIWWGFYARKDMTEEERIEDMECIGGLERDHAIAPEPVKRSMRFTYRYPEQETKLKTGDTVQLVNGAFPISGFSVDPGNRQVTFTVATKNGEPPDRICISSGAPVSTVKLKEAVFRFADSFLDDDGRYQALRDILLQALPRIDGHKAGTAIVDEAGDALPRIQQAIAKLANSYIFLQGPPGSGKTYTGSRVIVELLRAGKTVGVSSNSHKAINNLLAAVEAVAVEGKVTFQGVKKSTKGDQDNLFGGQFIQDVFKNEEISPGQHQLVAGTAWLFADPDLDQTLDFLFVDEAGQVALANLIAMGTSAKNIVLLGDQMQLGQPIQGVHPGRSGESALEYLLGGQATIPPDRGIFLKTTWRMHPDVCRLISDMVYDERLEAEAQNVNQQLILQDNAHPALAPAGVCYVPVDHDGCSQASEEEARVIAALLESLLAQQVQDKTGTIRPMTLDDILIVAPYNMQVNLLKHRLPEGARVGTVDKFQGQEADVVIVSMTTSSGEYLPRFIEFLYSKNRLNVALSRARCLALLVANPELMSIKCTRPEQMALVNALCWVLEYSEQGRNGVPAVLM